MGKFREKPDGGEMVESVPMSPPVRMRPAPDLMDSVRALVRSEMLRKEVASQGKETFEEADDFDVPDDDTYDPRSPYEEVFDPPPQPAVVAPTPPAEPKAKPKASDEVASGDADSDGKDGVAA